MNDSTQIKYSKVSAAVQTINTNKKNIQDILSTFEGVMNQTTTAGVLEGQAAEELTNKFAELKKKFDAYVATVTEFEGMITMAKESTESTEAKIRQAASDLSA